MSKRLIHRSIVLLILTLKIHIGTYRVNIDKLVTTLSADDDYLKISNKFFNASQSFVAYLIFYYAQFCKMFKFYKNVVGTVKICLNRNDKRIFFTNRNAKKFFAFRSISSTEFYTSYIIHFNIYRD